MSLRYGLIVGMALWLATATAKAEVSELKITKQPGLLFAPMLLMEHDKLVEKHAAQAGVPELKASWLTIMSGGGQQRCPAIGQCAHYHQWRHQHAAVVEQDQRRR